MFYWAEPWGRNTHHHHHHHHSTTTCHGAAWMDNTMKDFIVHFDWMDYIRRGGSRRGEGCQQSRKGLKKACKEIEEEDGIIIGTNVKVLKNNSSQKQQ